MKIDVAARETGGTRCPFCLDAVAAGPACPRCDARYHEECATIVGRCGVLACTGRLPIPAATGGVLPRLRLVALRLWRGRAPLDAATDAAAWAGVQGAVVALLPAPGGASSADGAALVGRLLRQTALDGRLRLSSPVPEPLLRVGDLAEATRIVGQLREVGLDGLAVPLGDLIRPLDHAVAKELVVERGAVRLSGEDGQPLALPPPADRLVIATQLVQVTKRIERRPVIVDSTGRARSTGRNTRTLEQKRYDPAALVFSREVAPPIVVRLSRLRLDPTVHVGGGAAGLTAATGVARWARLLEQLCAGGTHWTLAGSTNAMLLTPGLSAAAVGADEMQENVPSVLLAARLLHRAWLEGRASPARPEPGREAHWRAPRDPRS